MHLLSRRSKRPARLPGRRRRLAALVAAAAVAVVAVGPGTPASSTPATGASLAQLAPIGTDLGIFQSNLHANGWQVARDGGHSAAFNTGSGNQSIWLFGDTVLTPPAGGPATDPYDQADAPAWWRNNTAARGSYTAGTAPTHTEIGGLGIPLQLIPDPSQATFPCTGATYPWPAGAARITASQHILVPYTVGCSNSARWSFGIAQYDPATNQLVSNVSNIFSGTTAAPQFHLQAPVFSNGYVYFSKSLCDNIVFYTCAGGDRTLLARVYLGWAPADSKPWNTASNYEWWGGTGVGWTTTAASATSIIPPESYAPISTNMTHQASLAGANDFVLLEQMNISGDIRIWTAPDPVGPWTSQVTGNVGCDVEDGRSCRGLILHAELGTSTTVVASYAQVRNSAPVAKPTDDQVRLRQIVL